MNDQLMNEQGKIMLLDDTEENEAFDDADDADEAPSEADLVAELRDFLDTIRPEDFNQ